MKEFVKNHKVAGGTALLALLIGGGAAMADIMGSDSLADFVGSGMVIGHIQAGGHIEGTPPRYELTVHAEKDTSQTPAGIKGTVEYTAKSDLTQNRIHRIVYEVRDPDSSTWLTILDVTEPDASISNVAVGGGNNTFRKSYSHGDMERGIYYRVRVWPSASSGAETIRLSAGAEEG